MAFFWYIYIYQKERDILLRIQRVLKPKKLIMTVLTQTNTTKKKCEIDCLTIFSVGSNTDTTNVNLTNTN